MQFLAEIWTKILQKTDLLTCLTYGDLLAAEPFLVDQQGAMDTAIAADHRIGIGLLVRHGIGLLSPATAALNGNLDLMQRIMARGEFNDCTEDTFTEVVRRGYLDVLKWSHNNLGHQWCILRFWLAIEHGHIDIADWMLRVRKTRPMPLREDYLRRAVEVASMHGRLDVLRWLVQEADVGYDDVLGVDLVLSEVILHAASGGHLSILEWLEVLINDTHRLDIAIASTLRMGMNFRIEPSLLGRTIYGGSLGCLEWLWSHVPEIDFANEIERGSIVTSVAVRGHTHMLEWLQDNTNVPFTPQCMDKAAGFSLETVIWFHRNRKEGCTTEAMRNAAAAGRLDIVCWFHANRLEGCTTDAMDAAAANGNLDVVKWLHRNRREGCTKYAMDAAATNGFLEVVEWLHLHREEGCSTDAMDHAAARQHLHVVVWLQENRKEGCSDQIVDRIFIAASQVYGEVEPGLLDFLLEHYPEKCQGEPYEPGWADEDEAEVLKMKIEEFFSRAAALQS